MQYAATDYSANDGDLHTASIHVLVEISTPVKKQLPVSSYLSHLQAAVHLFLDVRISTLGSAQLCFNFP